MMSVSTTTTRWWWTMLFAVLMLSTTPVPLNAREEKTTRLRISQNEKLNRSRMFEYYLNQKAQRIPDAFKELLQEGVILHGSSLNETMSRKDYVQATHKGSRYISMTKEPEDCNLQADVSYSLVKIRGLDNVNVTVEQELNLHPPPGFLWNFQLALPVFEADMTAQLTGDICGIATDYTSYGHISIENALIQATLQLDGPNHLPHIIDFLLFDDHAFVIGKSNPTFQKLLQKVPERVIESSIYEFLHSLFTTHLQAAMQQQLTTNTNVGVATAATGAGGGLVASAV